MSDGTQGNGGESEEDIARALRRAADEARPREGFRASLRARFAEGPLVPAEPGPEAPVRSFPVPRWIAYPAAAALLLVAVVVSGALGPRAEPEPVAPMPRRPSAVESSMTAAERRAAAVPSLGTRAWQQRVVEGRAWLLPAETAFADASELKTLSLYIAQAEAVLGSQLPALAARPALPTVVMVAPDRHAFEALVGPCMAPLPVGDSTIAFALPDPGVLLVSPEALEPGGPPCEEMDVVHEAVHAWLHARGRGTAVLPLWADEGLAAVVSESTVFDTREWCARVLSSAQSHGMDPYSAEQVLTCRDYGAMVRRAAECAPCSERPYSMVGVFYAHGESLTMFLLEDHPGCVHRAAFVEWLGRALDGERTDAAATARALGFADPGALLRARDEWLRK